MMRLPYVRWMGRPSPVVEVALRRRDREVRTLAYVDTGAAYSIFHSDFCEALGIKLRKGSRMRMRIGDGSCMSVYVHRLRVGIESLEVPCNIVFSDRLGAGIGLIGRDGLLDRYKVCFDGRKGEIVWND